MLNEMEVDEREDFLAREKLFKKFKKITYREVEPLLYRW